MQDVKESGRMVLDAAAALALLRDSAAYGSVEQTYMNLYAAYPDEQSRAALASAAEVLKSEARDADGGAGAAGDVASAENAPSDGGSAVGSSEVPAVPAVSVAPAIPASSEMPAIANIADSTAGAARGPSAPVGISAAVPFLHQIDAAEISTLVVADAESRSWREPGARGPSFQERAQIAAAAISGGAASGAVQGVVSALVATAVKKGSTRIPGLGCLIESAVIAEDPSGWLAAAVDSTVGAAFRALEEMKSPGFTARLEAILAMIGAAAAYTGTLATIFEVVALALGVGGTILAAAGVGAALLAAAPLFFKAGLVLGGVGALLFMGQGAIRASLLGVSALSLLAEESSADEVSAKAAILESSASGFVRGIVITRTNAASVGTSAGNSASAAAALNAGSMAGAAGGNSSGGGSSGGVTSADRIRLRMAAAILDVHRFQVEKQSVRQSIDELGNSVCGTPESLAEDSVFNSPVVGSGTRMLAAQIAARQIEATGQLLKNAADFVSGPDVVASEEAEVNRAAAAYLDALIGAGIAAEIEADAGNRLEMFNVQKTNAQKLADETGAVGVLVGATMADAAVRKASAEKGICDADAMKAQAASLNDSGDVAAIRQLAGLLALVPGSIASGASGAAGNAACVADTASAVVASGSDMGAQADGFSSWFLQSVLAITADEQRLADAAAESQEASEAMLASAEECQAGADAFAELAAMAAQAFSQKMAESEQEKQNSEGARARLAEWAAGVGASSSTVENEAILNLDAAAAALAADDQS